MMLRVNTVVISGRLGVNPSQVSEKLYGFRMAHNKRYRDNNGEWKDQTTWLTVRFLPTERLLSVLQKGMMIVVSGELSVREYINSKGIQVFEPTIFARDISVVNTSPREKEDEGSENTDGNNTQTASTLPWSDDWGGFAKE